MGFLVVRRRSLFVLAALGLGLLAAFIPRPTDSTPEGDRRVLPNSRFLTRAGTTLVLHSRPYRVVGLNAYELATSWGTNAGCGAMLDDATLDAFFAGLPRETLVRVWGFQASMATNPTTGAREWSPLDRVVDAAARHRQLLIVSLGDQAGTCDDRNWKDRAWYRGGYRMVYPGTGVDRTTVSYWDWVHEIVGRYRTSKAIAMWEPVNEPEASDCAPGLGTDACYPRLQCPDQSQAAAALRSFFDVVGREIKHIDSNHLVESGALGGSQCGWIGADGARIHASPGIDVASYHDYVPGQVLPGELVARLREVASLHKPLLVGELGIRASASASDCVSPAARLDRVRATSDAMLAAGVAGVLLWDWVPNPQPGCGFDVGPGDPVLRALRVR